MLETDDMQRLLKTVGQTDEFCYGYNIPYQAQVRNMYTNRGSGKAVVEWLKLKAVFIRKKAAERRPQIVEIK